MDRIYIPTVHRVHQQATYQQLPPDLQARVTFVVQAWERDQYPYKAAYLVLPDFITPDHPRAIAETRLRIYQAGQRSRYAMLDDDLTFYRRNAKYWTGTSDMEKSSRRCTAEDMRDLFTLCSRWLSEATCTVCGCSQVGLPPRARAYQKNRPPWAQCFLNGQDFYDELPTMDLTHTRVGEDEAFHLSLASRGYGSRISTAFCVGDASSRGGTIPSTIWDTLTPEDIHQDQETLHQLFPQFYQILRHPDGSRVLGRKNAGRTKILWRKAYACNSTARGARKS